MGNEDPLPSVSWRGAQTWGRFCVPSLNGSGTPGGMMSSVGIATGCVRRRSMRCWVDASSAFSDVSLPSMPQPHQATTMPRFEPLPLCVVAHQRHCVRQPVPGLALRAVDDLQHVGPSDVKGPGGPMGRFCTTDVQVDAEPRADALPPGPGFSRGVALIDQFDLDLGHLVTLP